MQNILNDNAVPPIKANGLKSVLYARFHATRGLIKMSNFDKLVITKNNPKESEV